MTPTDSSKDLNPLVSIICLTYNHAPFIRDCIEGFLSQQTDFPFEIIIHDDASTDGTTEIVREYCQNNPKLFKSIIQKDNQYSQHHNFYKIMKNCVDLSCGEYIAFCEGDDFWTDSLKLQKQVNFLKQNSEYGLCYTDVMSYNVSNNTKIHKFLESGLVHSSPDFTNHLKYSGFIAPATWVFRKSVFPHITKPYSDLTFAMALDIMAKSKVFFMKEETAVYRVLSESVSHSADLRKKLEYNNKVRRIQNDYIDKYGELLSAKDINEAKNISFRKILNLAIYVGDKETVKEAKQYFKTNKCLLPFKNKLILLLGNKAQFLVRILNKLHVIKI